MKGGSVRAEPLCLRAEDGGGIKERALLSEFEISDSPRAGIRLGGRMLDTGASLDYDIVSCRFMEGGLDEYVVIPYFLGWSLSRTQQDWEVDHILSHPATGVCSAVLIFGLVTRADMLVLYGDTNGSYDPIRLIA